MTKKVLVSNVMMLNEQGRFDRALRDHGYEPVWADVKQFMGEDECLSLVGNISGWLAGDDRITRPVLIKASPALKVISKWGTGIDCIDLAAAEELGIPVCNSPGAFGDAVAEVAIGYILMLGRDLAKIDQAVRAGQWPKLRSRELREQTIGIIGFGAIGRGIARRAGGLGMNIVFYDPFVAQDFDGTEFGFGGASFPARLLDLDELARKSDFVCVACNLTQDNRHLVAAGFLAKMQPTAFLVNVSRGALIDESAVIDALQENRIAGVALDVFEVEPLHVTSPLRTMKNVVLGSHNANNGLTAVESVHQNTLKNLYRHLS